MSADRLGEVEVDRLGAAVFEQRRLSHMLRQRGVEIEALRDERERLAVKERAAREREEKLRKEVRELEARIASATSERERLETELGQARYEARRAERRVAKVESDAAEASKRTGHRIDVLSGELANVEHERQLLRNQLVNTRQQRDRAKAELTKLVDEHERRVAKLESDAAEARKQSRLQLDSLAAELREERTARTAATESVRGLEEAARQLGQAQREVELLTDRERKREALLADCDRMLDSVAENLLRTRASRSWRWGHALARAFRVLTFRRRSSRSALDRALGRLEAEGRAQQAQDDRGPA